jgi:predicted transcriptional regulator YheO
MRSPTEDTDAYVRSLAELASRLVITLGNNAEIVIHDFRSGSEGTIVAIFGNVTDRSIGGSMSRIGLEIVMEGDNARDRHNYVTVSSTGRTLKASTFVLRDFSGAVFGAFCVNIDVTDLRKAAGTLANMAGMEQAESSPVFFSNDYREVVRSTIAEEIAALGIPVSHLTREDRERLVHTLQERGIFSMQKGVRIVAEELGVSRTTIYNCISSVNNSATED